MESAVLRRARDLYAIYCASADGKNYQGLPCPAWDALTDAVRGHWCTVARRTFELVGAPESIDISPSGSIAHLADARHALEVWRRYSGGEAAGAAGDPSRTRAGLVILPEPMTCGRRAEMPAGPFKFGAAEVGADRWHQHANGDRVCSFCGSLHFDDFARLVRASADAAEDASTAETVQIEPSDKRYKVYVSQPGVMNAGAGGIKFYMQHVPRKADGSLDVTDEHNEQLARAVTRSRARGDSR